MLESFRNPPAEYRPVPFWFWNAELDLDEIERQVREMSSAGVGGFFIHGRFGLLTEYMGEHWMRCIERACEVAGQLGMHVYLYDENPFPSGVAGGEAMKDEKHFNKFLDIVRQPVSPGTKTVMDLPPGNPIGAFAANRENPEAVVDITDRIKRGRLTWTAPVNGDWEVLAFVASTARFEGFIYGSEPDYFEQGLVDKFFEFTHKRYAARLRKYFGRVIRGIFTDEPKIQCIYHIHEDACTTAWFADLPERFKEDHGYDLKPRMVCLVTWAGPDTARVRRDFWSTVTRCYIERFFGRYRDWCERHGIGLTGHLFLEEGLYANTMYQGDFPMVLSTFHIPGVDHLGLVTDSEYGIGNIPASITRVHGQKLAVSVAHAAGGNRVLSETYGCCGWALSLEHMKRIFDWQAAMGVNLLCPHAFYYSIAGARKTDAPPSQFYQATYWHSYRMFADYVGRVCWALSQGVHRAQVALLYPIKGFQGEWAPGAPGTVDRAIAGFFDAFCAGLIRQHIDYDIVTEQDLRGALALDQQLTVRDEQYELLIIPPTTAIGYDTAVKIREFAEDGGAVLASVLLPVEDADGDRHAHVRKICEEVFGEDPLQLRENVLRGHLPAEPSLRRVEGGGLFFNAAAPYELASVLRRVVCEAIRPEVSVATDGEECPDITYVHRRLDDADLFFFANSSPEPREVTVSVRCSGAPCVLDPETGSAVGLPNCRQTGGRTEFGFRFERYGSLLLSFGLEPPLSAAPARPEKMREIPLADEWTFRTLGPNTLVLDDWKLRITVHQDWTAYEYIAHFQAGFVPDDLMLVLDDMHAAVAGASGAGSRVSVFVNGSPAVDRRPWIVDAGFQVLQIARLAVEGTNEVAISIEHGGWAGAPELVTAPVRVMGNFSLAEDGLTLAPPRSVVQTGSWTGQGYPYYSGSAVYGQTVDLTSFEPGRRVLIRAQDPADMVEFVINGASAGVCAWAPFEKDITHLVRLGANNIEIMVTNSLENALLKRSRPSGLLGGAVLLTG